MPAPTAPPELDLLSCVPASIPSTQQLASGDEEFLSLAEACPAVGPEGVKKGARKKLPRILEEEGGEFVSVTLFAVKRGQGDQVIEQMRKVHNETDERELSVYSHRVLRGFADDEDTVCIIMEFDNPQAFHRHFLNSALQDLIHSPVFKTNRPKMSFFRELDS